MTRYLISFDDGAMTFPEEDLPDVAKASWEVVNEAKDAGASFKRRASPSRCPAASGKGGDCPRPGGAAGPRSRAPFVLPYGR